MAESPAGGPLDATAPVVGSDGKVTLTQVGKFMRLLLVFTQTVVVSILAVLTLPTQLGKTAENPSSLPGRHSLVQGSSLSTSISSRRVVVHPHKATQDRLSTCLWHGGQVKSTLSRYVLHCLQIANNTQVFTTWIDVRQVPPRIGPHSQHHCCRRLQRIRPNSFRLRAIRWYPR